MDLNEINEYIQKVYKVNTLINLNFANIEQICLKNNEIEYPYCSFYIKKCPEYGYAPNKLLIYHNKERKNHSSSGGSLIYDGLESIDWVMQNVFKLEKKEEQLRLF